MLFASAECSPIVQSGGLGEVAIKLPQALARAGHDVRIVIPWYGAIDLARYKFRDERKVRLVYNDKPVWAQVKRSDALGVPVYAVGHRVHTREMYAGKKDKYGWVEEHLRFRFFCAATAAAFSTSEWQPEVLHLNDYHSALMPTYWPEPRPAVVLTIHNARFQGSFGDWSSLPPELLDHDDQPIPPLSAPEARFINFLRRGIRTADVVVPVSRTYAQELLAPDQPDNIAAVLDRDRVVGIVNGIDTEQLDPRTDRSLKRRYDARTLENRATNKRALQRRLGFDVDVDTPLLAMVARIDPQKGIDLVLRLIAQLAQREVQVAITGNGGPRMRDLIVEMAAAAPSVLAYRPFVPEDENLYYGGADIMLVPSRYEPCGLVQLKALHYGAIPIVQRVGGLADTVDDHHKGHPGTGFVFDRDTPEALLATIDRALASYRRSSEWRALQRRAMARDVGWETPAAHYVAVYRQALETRR